MNGSEVITIIVSILVPMFAGFGWIIHQIMAINARLTAVETRLTMLEMRVGFMERLLEMIGIPASLTKPKIEKEQ